MAKYVLYILLIFVSWEGLAQNTSNLSGSFDIGPVGNATYNIPVDLPPGTAGLKPDISIVYNSFSGDGVMGKGFSLSAISSITRANTTVFHNGYISDIKFDNTDKNIVIYGHNIRDGSMFGSMLNILNAKWYENEENTNITLYTENEKCMYKVFSIYKIENEDYYIKTEFKNDNEFEDFIKTLKKRSIKDFNVDVSKDDNILTLSTCANNNKYRVVLHAKKVKYYC